MAGAANVRSRRTHLPPESRETFGRKRRGRDSNPRRTFWARTRFPVALLRPTRTPLRVRSEYRWARRRRESMGEPGWFPHRKRRGPADDVDEASETGLWGERNPAPRGPGGGRPRAIVPCHRSQTERGGFTVSVEPSDDAQDVRELVGPDRLSWPRVEPLPAGIVGELPECGHVPRDEDPDRARGSIPGRSLRDDV